MARSADPDVGQRGSEGVSEALLPGYEYERLSAQDSSFIAFERRTTPMHVAAIGIFELGPLRTAEGGLDAARLERYVESCLDRMPRYRQRLAFTPLQAQPVWLDDEHFDLHYHVRHTALPRPGGEEDLERLVGRILSQPLDRDRPLWEMWIIEGLEGDRFAILNKVHHCMVDGASGVSLMTVLFRETPDDGIPTCPAWFPRARPSSLRLAFDEVLDRVAEPLSLLRDLGEGLGDPERALREVRERGAAVVEALRSGFHAPGTTALNEPIGPHRRAAWCTSDLAEVKDLKRRLDGTVNDVVLAIVAGAVRRFLERRGEALEGLDYRVVIPVNMRSADGDPGVANRVSAFFLSLPVDEPDPLRRYERVREETQRMKTSRAADGIDFFTQLVDRAHAPWLTRLGARFAARIQPYNLIVSNVPGPQHPLYVLGARLLALHPLPPLFERQGLGVAVMSYDGRLCWGLVGDRDVLPDLACFVRDLEAAQAELRGAAASVRRPKRASRARGSPPSRSPGL